MNRELQGWQLVLALLIPVLVIGGAGWIAYQVLSGDSNQDLAIADEQGLDLVATTTPLPETQPVTDPTALPLPTALTVPTLAPRTPTPVPATTTTATTAPAPRPTSRPAPAPAPTSSGPAATATANPNVVTVSCGSAGTFPTELERGKTFGPLSVVVTPASAANTMQYVWDYGNGANSPGPKSGTISYDVLGNYNVRVTGTNIATQAQIVAVCGTIKVVPIDAPIAVTCTVKPQSSAVQWKDATIADALTVTVNWTPADVKLNLQYEFETFDPVVFSNSASPGDSKTHTFRSRAGMFSVFWRYPATGATGRLECPAFPETTTTNPTATVVATATPGPTSTPGATATAAPTATTAPTATPEPPATP